MGRQPSEGEADYRPASGRGRLEIGDGSQLRRRGSMTLALFSNDILIDHMETAASVKGRTSGRAWPEVLGGLH